MVTSHGSETFVLVQLDHLFQTAWEQLLHMHFMEHKIAELFS